ncbi:MAG: PASTA domain-containing protein [Bacilli bacterium]|nr:PASTA domain-containing protein [Bacilli bacterium]
MKKTKKKNIYNLLMMIIMALTWLISAGFLGYVLLNNTINNRYELIINSFAIFILITFFIIIYLGNDLIKKIFTGLASLAFIGLIAINFLIAINAIKLPTEALAQNLVGQSVSDAIKWSSDNNITYELIYEYSDSVDEYLIISQNVSDSTPLKDIDNISFTISLGPNYDTLTTVSNLVGTNIDEALESLNKLFLNNITVNYEENTNIEKDTIISQNIKGEMRRNNNLILTVSLGSKNDLEPISMIDLKNKSLFDAKLWLARNGISYKLTYEFSDTIERNYVISQSKQEGTTIDQSETTITLIISKGNEIVVPDLINMEIDEITDWIIDNNLKISYLDEYSSTVAFGKITFTNYIEGDVIEEGTTIEITTSKGPLTLPSFTTLSSFREWATKYGITINEEYEYNDTVSKGSIIKFSHEVGSTIEKTDTITVYISNGKAVTMPNFVGMTKSAIKTKCSNLGLSCSFYYSGYSSTTKDTATVQNKKASSTVISGTNVSIGLSSGPASTFTIEISEAQLSMGNADGTIATLQTWFSSNYPNVTFTFVKKASNTYDNAGFIHENSPVKDGTRVTQGNTYQVWITN